MLTNGKYSAWFKTPNGEGTGIVTLADGTITRGDSFFEYSGSYEQNGDRITATVRTRRVCDGPPAVFGIDEVELKLEGRSRGEIATCSGIAKQAPGVAFSATLIPCREEPLSAKAEPIYLSPHSFRRREAAEGPPLTSSPCRLTDRFCAQEHRSNRLVK
jgi:hypothetical protein